MNRAERRRQASENRKWMEFHPRTPYADMIEEGGADAAKVILVLLRQYIQRDPKGDLHLATMSDEELWDQVHELTQAGMLKVYIRQTPKGMLIKTETSLPPVH